MESFVPLGFQRFFFQRNSFGFPGLSCENCSHAGLYRPRFGAKFLSIDETGCIRTSLQWLS